MYSIYYYYQFRILENNGHRFIGTRQKPSLDIGSYLKSELPLSRHSAISAPKRKPYETSDVAGFGSIYI